MTKEERVRNIGLLCFSIILGIICFVVSRIGEGTPFAIYRMFGYMSVTAQLQQLLVCYWIVSTHKEN